jgi:FtsP/CotA-like multicopper oxidase with cupredoxin domain
VKIKFFVLIALTSLVLAACSNTKTGDMGSMDHDKMKDTKKGQEEVISNSTQVKTLTGGTINIVAKQVKHQLNKDIQVTAWTFNGSVPGSQIRVKQGEKVKINLKNELPDPVSIHWHGIPVPNEMDGIPGVTQNAVQPGESFVYEFTASVPGTYMYHTHQDGVNQLDKGLYGSFIVEPQKRTYDRDYTLMLDEWMSNPTEMDSQMSGMDHSNMSGMDNSNSQSGKNQTTESKDGQAQMDHNMSAYDVFTINGKSGESIEPLAVKKGERIRVRLINIGYLSHKIHLHGHSFKVVATDGQEVNQPQEIKDQLVSIAPGERYDIEFTADNPGNWLLESHGDTEGTEGMKTVINYEGVNDNTDKSNQKENLPNFNFNAYGKNANAKFTLNQKYDVEYTMDLNTLKKDGNTSYTINGKSFPETDPINIKKGDLVKVKLVNNSPTGDHPMHLHGHFFQVLSKNGVPIKGSPIMKDTINLKPGDEYVVALEANNPGNWLFHCHDLHHATAGMVDVVKYEGYTSNFTPDSNATNKPE